MGWGSLKWVRGWRWGGGGILCPTKHSHKKGELQLGGGPNERMPPTAGIQDEAALVWMAWQMGDVLFFCNMKGLSGTRSAAGTTAGGDEKYTNEYEKRIEQNGVQGVCANWDLFGATITVHIAHASATLCAFVPAPIMIWGTPRCRICELVQRQKRRYSLGVICFLQPRKSGTGKALEPRHGWVAIFLLIRGAANGRLHARRIGIFHAPRCI